MIRNGGRVVTAGLGEQLSAVHFKTLVMKEARSIATRVTARRVPARDPADGEGAAAPRAADHARSCRCARSRDAFAKVDRDEPRTIKVVLDVQQM